MPVVRLYTSKDLHSPHTNDEDIAEFRESAKSIDRDTSMRRLQILMGYDICERLGQINTPTLFLAGDRDRSLPSVRWANYMQDCVPNSSLAVLEGYGHVCLIEHDLNLTDHVVLWFEESCAEQPSG
jgi:pimeloyl-ACP methyl ester carboxylesterase